MSDSAPRMPSALRLELAISAWQQRAMYASDVDVIADEEVIATQLGAIGVDDARVLLQRAIDSLIWMERREEEADTLLREMKERRDRYRRQAADARVVIADMLSALELKSHRGKLGLATMTAGRPSLVILDEAALPDKYFRTERVLMRTPIGEALEAGEKVPGAVMAPAVPHLSVRKL